MGLYNLKSHGLPVNVPSAAPRTANAAVMGEYMMTAKYIRMAVGAWLTPNTCDIDKTTPENTCTRKQQTLS
jgi:hypothetical protein